MIATCQSSWRCVFWGNMEGYNVLLTHGPWRGPTSEGHPVPDLGKLLDTASWVSQYYPGWVPHY